MTDSQEGFASIARAFATYSLVPYLGIVFCPGALVMGSVGVARSFRSHQAPNARRVCYASAIVGLVVLVIQILLWWALYQVPLWARGF